MTKEEKLELVKKLNTQVDGVEAYIRQLKEAETDNDVWFLHAAESTLGALRKEIGYYEDIELKQKWRG